MAEESEPVAPAGGGPTPPAGAAVPSPAPASDVPRPGGAPGPATPADAAPAPGAVESPAVDATEIASEIAWFEHEAALAPAGPAAARLLLHVGHLHADRKGDREEAARLFARAAALDPRYRPIRESIRALHADAGDWAAVERDLAAELSTATEPAARAELMRVVAAVCGRRLGRPDAAAAWLRQAVELVPDHPALLLLAIEDARASGDAARELELCRRAAAGTRDERLKVRHLRRAALLMEATGDAASAKDVRRRLLELAPADLEAQAATLPELFAAADLAALEKVARAEVDAGGGAVARCRLAQLLGLRQGAPDDGVELLSAAREADPGDRLVIEALVELSSLRDEAAAEPHLRAALECARDPLEKARAAQRLARIAEAAGRIDDAKNFYAALAEAAPATLEAARGLARLAGDPQGTLDPSARLAAALAAADTPQRRADALWKLGMDAEERLGDAEKAAGFYEEALRALETHAGARNSLHVVCERSGRFKELAALLAREALAAAEGESRLDALLDLADAMERRLSNPAGALDVYRQALAQGESVPAARLLSRCAAAAGRAADLAFGLELEADGAAARPDRQIALLHRAAEAAKAAPAEARRLWERIRALDPAYLPARHALRRLYEECGNAEGLAELRALEPEAAGTEDAAEAEEAARSAIVARQWDRAAAALRVLVSTAPEHPTAWSDLALVCGRRGDENGRAAAFARLAALPGDAAARADAHYRLAEACEIIGDSGRAEQACDEAVQLVSGHVAAWRLLARLRLARGDAAGAAAALEREIAASDPKFRALAQRRLASLLADRLGRAPEAVAVLRQVLEQEPSDVEAVAELERLCRETGDGARSAELRGRLAAKSSDPRAAAALRGWAAADRARLGDEEGALNEYRRTLALDGTHREAADEVLRALRLRGDREKLADQYLRLQPASDAETRAWLALRRAELLEALGREDQALRGYREAAAGDGSVAALRAALRLHEKRGEQDEARVVMAQLGEALHDREAGTALMLRAAELAETRGDPEQAVAEYQKVLDRAAGEPRSLQRLDALLRSAGRYSELVAVYEKQAEACRDEARRCAALYAEAGWLRLEKLGEGRRAAIPMNRALAKDPACARALEMKAVLALNEGKAEEAEAALGAALAAAPAAAAGPLLRRLAQARLAGGRTEEAYEAAKQAADAEPESSDTQELLVQCAVAANALDDAEAAAEKLLANAPDFIAKARFARLAASLKEARSDRAGASTLYCTALELLPGDREATEALEKLHLGAKDFQGLASAFESLASRGEPKLASGYRERAVGVWADLANDPGKAADVYRRALQGAPDDAELRLRLARMLSRLPLYGMEALAELRRVAAQDPGNAEIWRDMVKGFAKLGMPDGIFLARAALAALGQADPTELGAHQAAATKLPVVWNVPLSPEDVELLVHPTEKTSPAREVMNALGAELPKVFPAELEKMGLGKADRVRGSDTRAAFDRLARLAGVGDVELYQSPRQPTLLSVENTEPPTVVIGSRYLVMGPSDVAFAMGMLLGRIRLRTHVAIHAVPIEMANLVAEALRLVDPSFARFGQRSEELGRRLAKAAGRGARKALEAALPRFSGPLNFAAYVQAMAYSSHRFGLLASGDPAAAAAVLAAAGRPVQNPSDRPELRELLPFAVGDDCLDLRRRLRVSLR